MFLVETIELRNKKHIQLLVNVTKHLKNSNVQDNRKNRIRDPKNTLILGTLCPKKKFPKKKRFFKPKASVGNKKEEIFMENCKKMKTKFENEVVYYF